MKNKIVLIIFCFLVSKISYGFSGQVNDAGNLPKNAEYIHEPVFNGKVYFYKSGDKFKTTVILVHGLSDDASDIWSSLVPVLEKQYRIIYFDLPGFGRSDKGDLLYSPQNYAAFIKWVYDKYVNGPMYLIGHSMGGAISLCYAGTYPDALQRLVLADAAGILHRTAFSKSIASAKVTEVSKLNFLQDQVELFSKFFETNLLGENQQVLPKSFLTIYNNSLLRKKLINSPHKIAALSLIYADFSEHIASIKAPLFIIWGENDQVAPLRTGKMLALNIPISSLNIMPGLGHSPMMERSSEFNDLIIKCLSDGIPGIKEKKPLIPNNKSITLNEKDNLILEGDYDAIEINNSRNILIKNVNATSITINNSWVEIENLLIKSEKTAVNVIDSIAVVTGGSFEGDVGLSVSNSKVDLAGVKITAKSSAVSTASNINSTVVFSVCRIISQFNNRFIHDIIEITKDNSL